MDSTYQSTKNREASKPHSTVHLGLRGHSVGAHYPYMVVAIGNPHSTEGVRWEIQRPDGSITNRRYAKAYLAENLALMFMEIDSRKAGHVGHARAVQQYRAMQYRQQQYRDQQCQHRIGQVVKGPRDCCPTCKQVIGA
jgi:hypothetical protein